MAGKYINEWYVIGGSKCRDKFNNPSVTYWITWLDTGSHSGGYTSAVEATRAADRMVEAKLARERVQNANS